MTFPFQELIRLFSDLWRYVLIPVVSPYFAFTKIHGALDICWVLYLPLMQNSDILDRKRIMPKYHIRRPTPIRFLSGHFPTNLHFESNNSVFISYAVTCTPTFKPAVDQISDQLVCTMSLIYSNEILLMQTARERSRSGGIKCRARIVPHCLQELLSCQPLKWGGGIRCNNVSNLFNNGILVLNNGN